MKYTQIVRSEFINALKKTKAKKKWSGAKNDPGTEGDCIAVLGPVELQYNEIQKEHLIYKSVNKGIMLYAVEAWKKLLKNNELEKNYCSVKLEYSLPMSQISRYQKVENKTPMKCNVQQTVERSHSRGMGKESILKLDAEKKTDLELSGDLRVIESIHRNGLREKDAPNRGTETVIKRGYAKKFFLVPLIVKDNLNYYSNYNNNKSR